MEQKILIEMRNIGKQFPGVIALQDVSLDIKQGTVLALMGENGAGKSTLMKILVGLYPRDTGTIQMHGKDLNTSSIAAVLQQGIAMIYQELNPVTNMTVAENIYLGREPYLIPKVLLDRKKIVQDARDLFQRLGIEGISPTAMVGELPVAKMQMIEIAKAVSYGAELIIMDEPTSAITERECQKLFEIVRQLKQEQNISFVFITHKMDEVFQISDEIAILRDGQMVGCWPAAELSHDDLIRYMVGREITDMFPKLEAEITDVKMSVQGLGVKGLLHDVSFDVRKGEILGFAGLMGAGRTEVMETIFGLRKMSAGEIKIDGETVNIRSAKDAIQHKIAFLTEDRRGTGCFLELSIQDNLLVCNWDQVSDCKKINYKKVNRTCKEQVEKFRVKTPSIYQLIGNLSGGNQQKVLIARWLMSEPEIIIVDEPTRGIDVGSKSEIHRLLSSLAQQGRAIIMISSELPEVLGMSDRVVVMHEGTITGILDRKEANQDLVLRYAAGLENQFAGKHTGDRSGT